MSRMQLLDIVGDLTLPAISATVVLLALWVFISDRKDRPPPGSKLDIKMQKKQGVG